MKDNILPMNLLEDYIKWGFDCQAKLHNHKNINEKKTVTKDAFLGPMYFDDIINIVDFLEKKQLAFEFRILDRLAAHYEEDSLITSSSITYYVFTSKFEFVEFVRHKETDYFERQGASDLCFIKFECYVYGHRPTHIRWESDTSLITASQYFWKEAAPDLDRYNIIEGLFAHIRDNMESFWFRHESRIYLYSTELTLISLLIYYKDLVVFIVWLFLFLILRRSVKTFINRLCNDDCGFLSTKKNAPMYLKKKRRSKLIGVPVAWITTTILGLIVTESVLSFLR